MLLGDSCGGGMLGMGVSSGVGHWEEFGVFPQLVQAEESLSRTFPHTMQ